MKAGIINVITVLALAGLTAAQSRDTLAAMHASDPEKSSSSAAWRDDFSGATLDTTRWIIKTGTTPGAIPNNHIGYYQPGYLSLSNGCLVLEVTQEIGTVGTNPNGVISRGAGISSRRTYGYGTYTWRMRMSSTASSPLDPGVPVSGSVSAAFIYVNNSQTEIDIEFSALAPGTLFLTNWHTINYSTSLDVPLLDMTSVFHDYKFVWTRGSISYYVDDVLQGMVTTNVPSAPAYLMISHRGTNSLYWGGLATIGIPRYFFIDSVSYTPPK